MMNLIKEIQTVVFNKGWSLIMKTTHKTVELLAISSYQSSVAKTKTQNSRKAAVCKKLSNYNLNCSVTGIVIAITEQDTVEKSIDKDIEGRMGAGISRRICF